MATQPVMIGIIWVLQISLEDCDLRRWEFATALHQDVLVHQEKD